MLWRPSRAFALATQISNLLFVPFGNPHERRDRLRRFIVQQSHEPLAVALAQPGNLLLVQNLPGSLHQRGNGKIADRLPHLGGSVFNRILEFAAEPKTDPSLTIGRRHALPFPVSCVAI